MLWTDCEQVSPSGLMIVWTWLQSLFQLTKRIFLLRFHFILSTVRLNDSNTITVIRHYKGMSSIEIQNMIKWLKKKFEYFFYSYSWVKVLSYIVLINNIDEENKTWGITATELVVASRSSENDRTKWNRWNEDEEEELTSAELSACVFIKTGVTKI